MASKQGILSDSYGDRFCLDFHSAPMGYFQSHYKELPPNNNLSGIKMSRYVKPAQKPQSLDIAAVNLGKLLHKNSHMSASFVLDKMATNTRHFKPPTLPIIPSIASASQNGMPSAAGPSRGDQLMAMSSGSSTASTNGTRPPINRTDSIEPDNERSDAPDYGSSESEGDHDLYQGGPAARQTAQEHEQKIIRAAARSYLNLQRNPLIDATRTPEQRRDQTRRKTGFSRDDSEIARQPADLPRTRSGATSLTPFREVFTERREEMLKLGDYLGPPPPRGKEVANVAQYL